MTSLPLLSTVVVTPVPITEYPLSIYDDSAHFSAGLRHTLTQKIDSASANAVNWLTVACNVFAPNAQAPCLTWVRRQYCILFNNIGNSLKF